MGQERECAMRLGRKNWAGKAYLETDFLLFRGSAAGEAAGAAGEGVRVKIQFAEMKKVSAEGGWLKVDYAGGAAWFELGAAAAKWADKILKPPSRMEKLGVRAGVAVAIEGELEADFVNELGATVKRGADLLFFGAKRAADLERIGKLKPRLTQGGAIWVIYPKGKTEIREGEVIAAGRAAGLKDTRVARFSETHTGLRFSAPRE